MNIEKELKRLNAVIVTHVFVTGPPQELAEYLKDKVAFLMFIGHPFYYNAHLGSFYFKYSSAELFIKKKAKALNLPETTLYIKDFIYTFMWVISSKRKFDLYIGADPLNALSGILLKKLKLTNKVIYYTIDYVPQRFNNKLLNFIYHRLDNYCVKNSDRIWNLSQRMTEERIKARILSDKQEIVPVGAHFDRIERQPLEKINRRCLVYLGTLRQGQGLELIINSFPKILEQVSDTKLIIIGTGPLEAHLKEVSEKLGIQHSVEFKGLIKSHEDIENVLTTCAIGLAPYEPDPNNFTKYADPSKPKQYMACGLPVIITRVPSIASEIEVKNAGLVVKYDRSEFINAATKLLRDDQFYKICRNNAIKFASEFEWNTIFSKALDTLLEISNN
jgi:glycosyltransferase involved in cell wall biosynthesis